MRRSGTQIRGRTGMIHLDTLENIKLYTAPLSLNFELQVLQFAWQLDRELADRFTYFMMPFYTAALCKPLAQRNSVSRFASFA